MRERRACARTDASFSHEPEVLERVAVRQDSKACLEPTRRPHCATGDIRKRADEARLSQSKVHKTRPRGHDAEGHAAQPPTGSRKARCRARRTRKEALAMKSRDTSRWTTGREPTNTAARSW